MCRRRLFNPLLDRYRYLGQPRCVCENRKVVVREIPEREPLCSAVNLNDWVGAIQASFGGWGFWLEVVRKGELPQAMVADPSDLASPWTFSDGL